jgi:Ca-activated chloride channel family protein
MRFENIEFLALIIIPIALAFLSLKKGVLLDKYFNAELLKKMQKGNSGFSKKTRLILLNGALLFAIVAFSRPVKDMGEVKVKSEYIDAVVAFDISKSMLADDVYPNRLEFSKQKFYELLDNFNNARIGVIGFSSRAFLISPLTSDYSSLKYLVKNMNLDYVSLLGTNLLEPLQITQNLLKNSKQKALIIFTDGGDQDGFEQEIAYAKEHNIKVFVYAVATKKGSVIKDKRGVLKDKNGNIVITKLNSKIKELAIKSGGSYMQYSLKKGDIKYLVDDIKAKFKATSKEQRVIKDTKELFYYPLIVAIILMFMGLFSLPRRVK